MVLFDLLVPNSTQYQGRAGNFANVWDPNITVPDGPSFVKGMMQVC
jgi:hypothetical protein